MKEKIAYWVDIVLGVGVIALTVFGQVAKGYVPPSTMNHAQVSKKTVEEAHSVCSDSIYH